MQSAIRGQLTVGDVRSAGTASTSACVRAGASSRLGGGSRAVRVHADKMCRDVVSMPKDPFQSKGKTYKLTFVGVGDQKVEVSCPDDMYILDAAEREGLDLPATCRGGICGACVGRIVSGTIDHSDIDDLSFTVNEDEQAQGMALLCMSRATSDLIIETQCDWGYSLGVKEWTGATGRFSAAPDPLMGTSWSE